VPLARDAYHHILIIACIAADPSTLRMIILRILDRLADSILSTRITR